jgi:hypothetical protein
MVLRFKFTARPIKPSWVQREYLKRMVQAFAAKDIRFATGAMVLQTLPSPGTGPVNEPGVAADEAARAAATTIAAASMVEAAGG